MTANQQLEVAKTLKLKQDVQPMSVSTQPTIKKITDDNSSSAPETIGNHQAHATDNRADREGSLPAASAVHTATNATADRYGISYELRFGPYLNTMPKTNIEPTLGTLYSGLIGEIASTS